MRITHPCPSSFEWPPGSGAVAEYDPHELEFVRAVIARHDRGEITDADLLRHVQALHDVKLTGGRMLPPERESAPTPGFVQPPLSDPDADTIGKFHAGAPPTEVGAALRVHPRTGTQKRLILDAVAASGDAGLIDEEIAHIPGVADTAHRTRRNELVEGGWVEDSGRTRPTASDAPSIVWVLTERGRRQYGRG